MANQVGPYVHNVSGCFATQKLKEGLIVLICNGRYYDFPVKAMLKAVILASVSHSITNLSF